jgi:hypothetical protein
VCAVLQHLSKLATLVFDYTPAADTAGSSSGSATTGGNQQQQQQQQQLRVPRLADVGCSEHDVLQQLVSKYSIPEDAR